MWNIMPDYVSQESALDKLFFGDFKYNDIFGKYFDKV